VLTVVTDTIGNLVIFTQLHVAIIYENASKSVPDAINDNLTKLFVAINLHQPIYSRCDRHLGP
jgi:hypothetical protein